MAKRPPKWPDDFIGKVIQGDCREIVKLIPDGAIDAIITDPIWPGYKVKLPGWRDPFGLLQSAAADWPRLTGRAIVVLSCIVDPRFLMAIPKEFEFVRECWLRRVPVKYHGSVMISADVGYVFGHKRLAIKGSRVLPGETFPDCLPGRRHYASETYSVCKERNWREFAHPCPRMLEHMCWLVQNFTKPGDLILDPFCGQGTTMIACQRAGRRYIGIDIKRSYVTAARNELSKDYQPIDGARG